MLANFLHTHITSLNLHCSLPILSGFVLACQTARSNLFFASLLLLHQMHLHHQLIVAVTLYLLLCSSTAAAWGLSWSRTSTTEQQNQPKGQHGQIASLPGYAGDLPSKHYSGYISVGSRQLFYYAVESERTPAEDPVV